MNKTKIIAIKLRKNGKSYNEISKKLNVSKGTLSYWFRDKGFSIIVKQKLIKKSNKIWAKNIIQYNKNRSRLIKDSHLKQQIKATGEIASISLSELKLLGIALYWAEGGKMGKRFEFTNSDPAIIKIIIQFLDKICLIKKQAIKIQLNVHTKSNILSAKKYWQKTTGIPSKNFYKTNIYKNIASKGKRPKNRLPYGTIQLRVYNTELFNKILGWIQGLANQAD